MKLTSIQEAKAALYETITELINPTCTPYSLDHYLKTTQQWPIYFNSLGKSNAINDSRIKTWIANGVPDTLRINAWRVKRPKIGWMLRVTVSMTVRAQPPRECISVHTEGGLTKVAGINGAQELWSRTARAALVMNEVRVDSGFCTAACYDWIDRVPAPQEIKSALNACVDTVIQPRLLEVTRASLEKAADATPEAMEKYLIKSIREHHSYEIVQKMIQHLPSWITIDMNKINAAMVNRELSV